MLNPRHPSSAGRTLVLAHVVKLHSANVDTLPRPGAPATGDPIVTALGVAARRRLHAIHPAAAGQEAAATAFAFALVLALDAAPPTRPLLWVQAETAARESGRPYGPGLAALGLDPARLVVVAAQTALAVLAAAEMGLEEAGLAGVVVDLPARLPADMLKLGKRLSLRAEQRSTPCCLLHAGPSPVEMPVASRWTVASRLMAHAGPAPDFTPAFDLNLIKNRFGALGRWSVAWRPCAHPPVDPSSAGPALEAHHVPRFAFTTLAPLPEPVAAAPADRPSAAPRGAQPQPLRPAAA